jgi:hypothetical protein
VRQIGYTDHAFAFRFNLYLYSYVEYSYYATP